MPSLPLSQVMVILVVIIVLWLSWLADGEAVRRAWRRERRWWKEQRRVRRTPKARGSDSCADCCAPRCETTGRVGGEVVAWTHYKRQAGRPKIYDSEGVCCLNKACPYYRVRDEGQHALVRDGWRGKAKDIPYWRCQACGKRFSGRRETPLYHLKTPAPRVAEVLTSLGEGVDVAASSRIFGHHPTTISRWLQRAAVHGERLHQRYLKNVEARHIQMDELVTRVRSHLERVFVWTAVDAQTKVLLAVHIGRRTQADANRLVHRVKQVLTVDGVPLFTTDGLRQYFYAITAHFGQWITVPGKRKPVWQVVPSLLYGQLRKVRSGYSLKFVYTRVLLGTKEAMTAQLQALGFSGQIQTAFVERLNLTLRELAAPLRRRTWSLAHDEATLALYLGWVRTYYHFMRYHEALIITQPDSRRRTSRTPMMAAHLTRRRWSVVDFLALPLAEHLA